MILLLHRHRVLCSQRSSSFCQPIASFISSHLVLTFGVAGVHHLVGIIDTLVVVVVVVRKGVHGRLGAGFGVGGSLRGYRLLLMLFSLFLSLSLSLSRFVICYLSQLFYWEALCLSYQPTNSTMGEVVKCSCIRKRFGSANLLNIAES